MKREKMCKISFSLMLFMFFFTTSYESKAVQNHTSSNSLVITKDINFEIEIQSALNVGVDPVELDFGDIQRNTRDKIVKQADLKFKAAFDKDVNIKVEYDKNGDLMQGDPNYAKYQIDYVNKNGESYQDKIDVYLKRVESQLLPTGTTTIPIVGEIREVGNVRLGEYKKTIEATVYATPVSPVENMKNSKLKGGI